MPVQELNALIAGRVTDQNARLTQATADLDTAKRALTAAKALADAAPADEGLKAAAQAAKHTVDLAEEGLTFEKQQLNLLLRPAWYQKADMSVLGYVLQWAVFGGLALTVLIYLLSGTTGTSAAGATPRGMITFLIAVVTVGIAIILVLATVISDSSDRERRFSQGKEILTAFLGILGTIVGFYFGVSKDEAKGLELDTVAIVIGDNGIPALTATVRGGKAPYAYTVTFKPSAIPAVEGKSADGKITAHIDKLTADTDVTFKVAVTDSEGKTGVFEQKVAVKAPKPPTPLPEPKKVP